MLTLCVLDDMVKIIDVIFALCTVRASYIPALLAHQYVYVYNQSIQANKSQAFYLAILNIFIQS